MRAVATADASSSSSAVGSRTQTACRIELRFIALGALESGVGVATSGLPIHPARFIGKEKGAAYRMRRPTRFVHRS